MSFEDELMRRFEKGSTSIEFDRVEPTEIRNEAMRRNRARSAVLAAAAALLVVVAGTFVLRAIDEPANPTLEVAATADRADPDNSGGPTEPADADQATNSTTSVVVGEQMTEADWTYLGAFIAPATEVDGSLFAFGGEAATFNPFGDPSSSDGFDGSMFLSGHPVQNPGVAEITIPAPLPHDGTTNGLPIAELLGPFVEITGGRASEFVAGVDGLDQFRYGGLEVVDSGNGPRLHWTVRQSNNVTSGDLPGHGHSSLDPTDPDPQGPWHLGDIDNRFSAGYVFTAPDSIVGGDGTVDTFVAGFRGGPATFRHSWGPPFFGFDPPLRGEIGDRLAVGPIAQYPDQASGLTGFGQADQAGGAEWISHGDVAAVVTVGFRGLGEVFQGEPREQDCGINVSVHAGPYEPQIMFYDPADFAAAAAGEIEPSELEPYRRWNPAEHMIRTCQWDLSSISYDAASGRIYVVQREADTSQNEFSPVPVVHVFQL